MSELECPLLGPAAPLPMLPHLFVTLREVGYDGWSSVEDFTAERPLADRVRENLRYLRGALAP